MGHRNKGHAHMNTSATLEHLRSRRAHVFYDLQVEQHALRHGYGDTETHAYLLAKHARLDRACCYLASRRNNQLAAKYCPYGRPHHNGTACSACTDS